MYERETAFIQDILFRLHCWPDFSDRGGRVFSSQRSSLNSTTVPQDRNDHEIFKLVGTIN